MMRVVDDSDGISHKTKKSQLEMIIIMNVAMEQSLGGFESEVISNPVMSAFVNIP